MNLELTREEASAVVAAIDTLREELLAAKFDGSLNRGEARLCEVLGNVAVLFAHVESLYD
jgi:hypothetical protein